VTQFFDTSHSQSNCLDSLTSPFFFQTPIVSLMIEDFKFQGIEGLAHPFAYQLSETLQHTPLSLPHIITPVPLHPRRLRDRGYNQSALLATSLTTILNTPLEITECTPLLKRIKNTPPQSKQKSRVARLAALDNAFALAHPEFLPKDKVIWLVDDVATTRTTLERCAEVLKRAGAREVHGIVIAR
jgi:ComF family protein